MNTDNSIILGISPGTRLTGCVVMRNRGLIDWRMLGRPEAWSQQKFSHILGSLRRIIRQYRVTALVVKVGTPSKKTLGINQLTLAVLRLAETEHIKVYAYSINDLKREYGAVTTLGMARELTELYPDLAKAYASEAKGKQNPYYLKLFEAVACARMHSR